MTKIAYIRATQHQHNQQQQQQRQQLMMPQQQESATRILQPSIPSMINAPRPVLMNQQMKKINNQPKPMIMMPTTRFNTNPNILIGLDQQQQNGIRISKPLMEKRRRARINQCLSQLKTIVVDSAGQLTQNNKCKLEKADILELTVNYVQKLHQNYQQQKSESNAVTNKENNENNNSQFMAGYSECIKQICEYLNENQSNITYELLKKYLQQSLSSALEHSHQQPSQLQPQSSSSSSSIAAFVTPPSPAPSSESSASSSSSLSSSPVSKECINQSSSLSSSSSSCLSQAQKSQTIIENRLKRKHYQIEYDIDDNDMITDDDMDDYDEINDNNIDHDDYDHGYGSDDHHQLHQQKRQEQQENFPLNLKIQKHNYGDDDDDVWRPW